MPESAPLLIRAFERSRKALARLVARIVKPHDVEDIVQETFIRIYQASQTTTIHHAQSFMLRTARNLALNHVGRADALNHLGVDNLDSEEGADPHEAGASSETLLQAQEEFLLFCRALRDLSPQCRRAFILRKVYDLPQREIARRLGIAESTVEKHIARGLRVSSEYLRFHGYPRAAGRQRRRQKAVKGVVGT